MKQYVKTFFLAFFFVALYIVFMVSKEQEQGSIMGCPVITEGEAVSMIAGKEPAAVSSDLLYFEEQPLPYISGSNTFLVPVEALEAAVGSIGCSGYGQVYFILEENQEAEGLPGGMGIPLIIYIINDTSYIETSVTFTTSTILTFQTDAFENGNAYGEMKLYTPADEEIHRYSYKHSEAKLSYEPPEGQLPLRERNYELKLSKNGVGNKMSLVGLRKDDDWELDSLMECGQQILQFYEEWNSFCRAENESRFTIQYQVVELYLDGQFMGDYMLKVPVDDKQLQGFEGVWLAEAELESAVYGSEIQELFKNIIPDHDFRMECSFWQEEGGSLFAIPKKCSKIVETEMEQY